jgi:hypothetical protein
MPTKANWLLALVLAALLAPHPSMAAEKTGGGSIEVGGYTQDIDKDGARVNEYSRLEPSENGAAYGLVDLHGASGNSAGELTVDLLGKETPEGKLNLDLGRIFRLRAENSEFRHQLDHDRIDYMNAAVPGANLFAPGNPGAPVSIDANGTPAPGTSIWSLGADPSTSFNPNNVPGYIGKDALGNWYATNLGTPPTTIAGTNVTWQQVGRASVYGEDFAADQVFEITRKEAKAESDLTLPFLPNITFHAGVRVEERDGTEQSIGMSKCTACHVTGSSRKVDEKTEEFAAGATGRFGLLTLDYGFKTSEFRERAPAPTRVYDPALSPSPATTYTPGNAVFDNRLLYDYEDGALVYDQTPDSEKQSHVVKARLDFSRDATLIGSFVDSTVESKKTDEPGIWTLGDKTLTSNYDGYGIRLTTKLSDTVRLNLRGKLENVETDDSVIVYEPMGTTAQPNLGGGILPATIARTYESVESRDVLTVGTDMVWRLARKSSLRLGYEYKADDRDDEHYGKTTKQTAEATYRTALAKGLTFRAGYTFQAIDDPFMHENAAGYIDPLTGLHYTNDPTPNVIGTGPLYGTAFYDNRQTDLSNQPETVHEGKVASTWSPAANFSTTVALRYRDEGNELGRSEWTQQTISPSLSFWYAPAQKLNLTFAYNYFGQRAESRFCQGWYDG